MQFKNPSKRIQKLVTDTKNFLDLIYLRKIFNIEIFYYFFCLLFFFK